MIAENTFGVELRRQAAFMTRFLRAPRDLVFDALVEPALLARWCGPIDFSQSVCEVELWRDGAHWHVLRGPDGRELTLRGTYWEVTRPERLVYTERFEVRPHASHEHVVNIALTERAGGTTLTLTERLHAGGDLRNKMQIGAWEANLRSLDRLAELVESMSAEGAADDARRDWALIPVPVESDDAFHRPSGTYARADLGAGEHANEAKISDRTGGRKRALERFAALFTARR